MKSYFKQLLIPLLASIFVIGGVILAGYLTPTNETPEATYVTLEDIYEKLTTGATTTEKSFTPTEGTDTATMHTLQEIFDLIYDTATMVTVEPNLVVDNIIDGISIFGVEGNYKCGGDGLELHSGQTISYGINPDDADNDGTEKSYTDNGDGTVTDDHTGLVWQKNHKDSGDVCQLINWETALSYCSTLASEVDGLTDNSTVGQWRLPSYVELATLPDMNYPSGSYLNSIFTQNGWGSTCHGYWSSTTLPTSDIIAYIFVANAGTIGTNRKDGPSLTSVRCVRD